jgi:hypothetical protein
VRPSTVPIENGQASSATSATSAHSPMCPGLTEIGVDGFCSFNRHFLNASDTPNNVGDRGQEKAAAARVVTPHKTKAAFTQARVVSTRTSFGQSYAGEDDDSSEGSGHNSDPKEFDEDDDDSNPSCSPTCCCNRCYTSGESNEEDEPKPDGDEEGAVVHIMNLESRTTGRISQLLSMLDDPVNLHVNSHRWSRREIEERFMRLCTFQQHPKRSKE